MRILSFSAGDCHFVAEGAADAAHRDNSTRVGRAENGTGNFWLHPEAIVASSTSRLSGSDIMQTVRAQTQNDREMAT